MYTAYHHP